MRVVVSTELSCSVPEVWALARTPWLMRYVSWPLTVFTPLQPAAWPEQWQPGDHRVGLRALGVLPIGAQTISISFPLTDPDAGRLQLRDNGSGQLVQRWDHLITVEPAAGGPPGRTAYTDEIDVDAGVLTVVVWLWAHMLYRWRQRRWRRLTSGTDSYRDTARRRFGASARPDS